MHVNLEKQIQIKVKAQVRVLLFDNTFTEIQVEYSDYSNIFLIKNTTKLSKNIKINKHTIKLETDKQSLFGSIYSLRSIKLETFKIYIEINLANDFI